MRFGLRYCNTGPYSDPARAVALVQAAEEAGFESAWTVEHTVVPSGYQSAYPYSPDGKMAGGIENFPLPDPLIWMSYVAAATSRIKLATGILILPQHNPVITAKQVATLDHMSAGRVLLGIGVGWLEEEFRALGADFPSRGPRTDEYIQAMRALWSEAEPTFQGEYVSFEKAYCQPQPAGGSVPIIVGGHTKAAARRAGRLGDGFFPARGLSRELLDVARRAATDAGRDPDALEITTSFPPSFDDLEGFAALGVDRVLVPINPTPDMAACAPTPEAVLELGASLARYAD